MSSEVMEILRERIKRKEGLRVGPYFDTCGLLTIGYGRNLDANGITRAEAELMLETDLYRASDAYFKLPVENVKNLNHARRRVIVEMIFNMGLASVKSFRKMWRAIMINDFDRAATEMLDSRWAGQVGRRAVELADIMREGE